MGPSLLDFPLSTPEQAQVAIDAWLEEGGMERLAEEVCALAVRNGVVEGLGLDAVRDLLLELWHPYLAGSLSKEVYQTILSKAEYATGGTMVLPENALGVHPPRGVYRAMCEGWLCFMVQDIAQDRHAFFLVISLVDEVKISSKYLVLSPDIGEDDLEEWGHRHPVGWTSLPPQARRQVVRAMPALLAWRYGSAPPPWEGGEEGATP